MWGRRALSLGILLVAALPSAALADRSTVRALAPRDLFDAGPAIAGTDVVYAVTDNDTIHLATVPAAGGGPAPLPDIVTDGLVEGITLAADAERLALHAYVAPPSGANGRNVLYSARIGEALGVLADPAASLASSQTQSLFVAGSDIITREGRKARLVVRDADGARSEPALPAGARRKLLTITGSLLAVPVTTGKTTAIVVLDRGTGAEVRRVPVDPRWREILALAVGPAGELVYVSGSALLWSPAGDDEFFPIPRSSDVLTPVIRGTTLAFAGGSFDRSRATVVELPTAPAAGAPVKTRVLFQGPPTEHVRTLDFDGAHLAWSSTTCQFLVTLPAASTAAIPPGPCIRSDATYIGYPQNPTPSRPWILLGVRCLAAADGVCHITVRAYLETPLATGGFDVPVGTGRTVMRVRLSRKALRRVAGRADEVVLTATLRDPSGRTYTNTYVP